MPLKKILELEMNKMRMNAVAMALFLVVALLTGNLLMAQARSVAAAPGAKVAVIDMEKVLDELDEKLSIEARMRDKDAEFNGQVEDLRRQVEELQARQQMLNEGGADFARNQQELEMKAFQLQGLMQFKKKFLERELLLEKVNLYRRIVKSAEQVARQQGFNVVLVKELPIDDPELGLQEQQLSFRTRKVLWASDELDISRSVVTMMNNDFKNPR